MRVLQINTVCGIGSTGRIAVDIHNILREQGHESYIAYGRGMNPGHQEIIKIGSDIDNYYHVLLTRVFDKHGYGSKKATKDLVNRISEIKPDIIHFHNLHGYYLNIDILLSHVIAKKIPVIWTMHDCWAFTGHCTFVDNQGCEKWKRLCTDCKKKNHYPKSILFSNTEKNYLNKKELFTNIPKLVIVTPSIWLSNIVTSSFLGIYPVQVINNGIDTNIFRPNKGTFKKRNGIADKFLVLGVANNWTPRKGYDYFIELSKLLDNSFVIAMVGLTEKEKEKLPDNIIGITKTNDINELVEIYSEADAFLNPTLDDNFPTTNLEALACGTPVITFNTGGSAESIDDTCGIIVDKGDTIGIYNTINYLYKKNLGSSDCVRKAKEYDKKKKFVEYLKLYESFVEK